MSSSTSKRLYWQKIDGQWKIVGREYGPSIGSLKKDYLESKKESVNSFLADWQDKWLKADLDQYLSKYDQKARQGKFRGKKSIMKHKGKVWAHRKPASLEFEKIRIHEHPGGVEVAFRQKYSDVSGYRDKGLKKLVLRPNGDSWVIVDEQWRKL